MANFSLFQTAVGTCGIAWRDDRVIATHLPEASEEATAEMLARRAGASEGDPSPVITSVISAIVSLLVGERTDLSGIDCDFSTLEPLAVRVYDTTRAIPPGETRTYGEIASQLGDRRLAQRVGQLMGRNPLPIIVPCHRVIGADGRLTGFSAFGGVRTKQKILAIEGAMVAAQQSLFDS